MNNPKYCKVCGYVDIHGIESKCKFCSEELESTEESYAELQNQTENNFSIPEYIRQLYVYTDELFNEDKSTFREQNDKPAKVICPVCGSDQIQIVKRGWKITTGLIGSDKNERVCVNCMNRF